MSGLALLTARRGKGSWEVDTFAVPDGAQAAGRVRRTSSLASKPKAVKKRYGVNIGFGPAIHGIRYTRLVIVQIYEITSAEEAGALSAMGVDHIGILVGDGSFPREVSIERARDVMAAIASPAKASVLALSQDLEFIIKIVEALRPPILHLGAAPEGVTVDDTRTLKRRFPDMVLMRSIPVIDEQSVEFAKAYAGVADFLLLDSYSPGDKQIGALGVTHNWNLDRRIVEEGRVPVIIAGGLGPDNVAEAIGVTHPVGVDSKTKTDKTDGSHTKDLARVRAFVRAARGAL